MENNLKKEIEVLNLRLENIKNTIKNGPFHIKGIRRQLQLLKYQKSKLLDEVGHEISAY